MSARTNAQPWPGIRLLITNDLDLIVEVKRPEILVRSGGGKFGVTYKKSPDAPQLVLKSEWLTDGKENPSGSPTFAHGPGDSPTTPRTSAAGSR